MTTTQEDYLKNLLNKHEKKARMTGNYLKSA